MRIHAHLNLVAIIGYRLLDVGYPLLVTGCWCTLLCHPVGTRPLYVCSAPNTYPLLKKSTTLSTRRRRPGMPHSKRIAFEMEQNDIGARARTSPSGPSPYGAPNRTEARHGTGSLRASSSFICDICAIFLMFTYLALTILLNLYRRPLLASCERAFFECTPRLSSRRGPVRSTFCALRSDGFYRMTNGGCSAHP